MGGLGAGIKTPPSCDTLSSVSDAIAKIQANSKLEPLYSHLILLLKSFATFDAEIKIESLDMVAGKAFLEVWPKRDSLVLKIVTQAPIVSPRLKKAKKAGRHRFLNEAEIKEKEELDAELMGWIKFAYSLITVKS